MTAAPLPEGDMRPPEIEGFSNLYLVHPLSARLLPPLLKRGVHPNLVSLAGFILGACTALIYRQAPGPLGAIGGLFCLYGWLVLDGVDGKLARATGKASPTGKIVDGIADYFVFILTYWAMAYAISPRWGAEGYWLAAAAGASHIVQAAALELARERYVLWTRGDPFVGDERSESKPRRAVFPLSIVSDIYDLLQHLIGGTDGLGDKSSNAGKMDRASAAASYRSHFAPLVKHWAVLSANNHAFLIFLCVLAGRPEYYFYIEIAALNALLSGFLWWRRRVVRRFADSLDAAG